MQFRLFLTIKRSPYDDKVQVFLHRKMNKVSPVVASVSFIHIDNDYGHLREYKHQTA